MSTGVVLVIAAINAVALYFLSLLAVGGGGEADGIRTVRLFGFAWIALCTAIAYVLCRRGRGALGATIAIATLPTGYAASLLAITLGIGWSQVKPNSAAFEAACREAATTFHAKPGAPVQSIAYDWLGRSAPQYNYFSVDARGNVDGLRGGIGAGFPSAIRFTEGRCCRFEGPPTNRVRPYIRRPNPTGGYFGVTELTADALVMLSSTPVAGREADSSLTRFDVVVSDRRDGKPLATMRYFLDAQNRRGCVAGGVMDERAFVLKAVDVL